MTSLPEKSSSGIGTLKETSLHAALKAWYAQPGDRMEAPLDGFVVDILRDDLVIEIQTGSFSSIKGKLGALVQHYPLLLVYPIPREKWIVRLEKDGFAVQSRRKSPRRGSPEHLFLELVRIASLAAHPKFSLEVLLTSEEEVWRQDGSGSWRRKGWSIHDRRLLAVLDSILLRSPQDYLRFLPPGLPPAFTTADLSLSMDHPRYLAQKMVYCLHAMGILDRVGRMGKAYVYTMR